MMKNNIYGVLGVEAINSNWNADFDGMPKEDGLGNIKGSPYSLQYCIKRLWELRGEKILGLKSVDEKTGKIFTLEGKFNSISTVNIKKEQSILQGLLECRDVKNFGVVYAVSKVNLGVQGVVQIQDGMNKFDGTIINSETILSPFVNSNKDTNGMTTNGVRVTINEAHYLYPLTIMPSLLEDYTEEDYEDFKNTSLKAVTLYNSKSKSGCKNEFGLFVKVKEEYNYILALGDLSQYITIDKKDNKIIYDLTELSKLLNDCEEKIESIEIYYRSVRNDIEGLELGNVNLKKFDIITGKEL